MDPALGQDKFYLYKQSQSIFERRGRISTLGRGQSMRKLDTCADGSSFIEQTRLPQRRSQLVITERIHG
ncbi:MAG: hypothetical protein ACOYEV_16855 [Candidatus Nanopelagicales bacterium]